MAYDREKALALVKRYNQSNALIRHALAVEAVMRRFARHFGEDADRYGVVGLLHDLDYELYPQQHCQKTGDMMREAGYGEEDIRAVLSHGYSLVTDVEPLTNMEKTLFTIDELTGLITAAVYMRPSKSILDMELKSVKKKFKQPSFAAGVNRDIIVMGAGMLGMELDAVIQMAIEGMQANADELGLAGGASALTPDITTF